ncbi:cytochrome aa3 quinol oxidase subunit III [Salinicoccus sp. ID82-1]|uniref:cytochrome aa3 quinol oxidase subunit III n=1 Tax=Salinicoccus sp. ID82-1 TaxID=2820269 RepID=UPI001F0276B3|nr:cytochrome aa3 quinol oxidase subunit III [Salinicoccus sp. ID82-1]MCG1010710.1 cytochrome aa3 quinol oxidase subunit III [Salinicoccus sp. ID82-1]
MSQDIRNHVPLEYSTEDGQNKIIGFWLFLAGEMSLFGTLFATHAVLTGRTADDPGPAELFQPDIVLVMTFLLLTSSFTCGLAIHFMREGSKKGLIGLLVVTLLLGTTFLGLEIYEFVHYVSEGVSLQSSAYWSAFFTLTGTHGLHVTLGIVWMILLIIQITQHGLTPVTTRKAFIVSLYWHFLDVIWIFIFSAVYMLGMVI